MRNLFFTVFLILFSQSLADVAKGETMQTKMQSAFDSGELPGLHAVAVMIGDDVIGEAYFPGEDERWGQPIGLVEHGPNTLHDLRSVTKSIVGLLYGIALQDGLVPALDTPVLTQFPNYPDLMDGTMREDITVRNLLTLQMGTAWDESLPYTDPRNSEVAMELADDRYYFVLSQPMVDVPGTSWSYNGGAVAVVAKLIADGSGMPLDQFAKTRLFDPLGIDEFDWIAGSDGEPSAASGLRLSVRDLAKIGSMVANNGTYDGQIIVPADWLAQSFEPAIEIQEGFHYGFLWYVYDGPGGDRIAAALGNGAQRLTVQPSKGS